MKAIDAFRVIEFVRPCVIDTGKDCLQALTVFFEESLSNRRILKNHKNFVRERYAERRSATEDTETTSPSSVAGCDSSLMNR
jgi:hypothetical protein